MKRSIIFLALVTFILGLAACSPQAAPTPTMPMEATMAPMASVENGSMDGMDGMAAAPAVPAGMAYAEGQEIRFMHTEVSDQDVAKLLSDMMTSPVLFVPSLANAPDNMLSNVYVFNNGVQGMGPLGYQPDIFDNPPGTEGYTPLRKIVFVTWTDESKARELKALAEVLEAEKQGEVTLQASDVVVNMPFVVWDGGSR